MRICIPVPCFFRNVEFPRAVKAIGEMGFDALETYNWKILDLDAARAACEGSGVEFISMCTTEFRLTDPSIRGAWLDGLRESVAAANKVGAKRLITQVGNDTGEPRGAQRDSIVEGLRAARPILEDGGVTIMIEPLNTIVDHKGYYLWSSAEGFDIVREVGHPLVKVVYDIYHQQVMEGNIIPNVTKNLDAIAHLHCAGHPGRNELQYGENDYAVIFKTIDDAGYAGACGLEYTPLMDPIESLETFKKKYMTAT